MQLHLKIFFGTCEGSDLLQVTASGACCEQARIDSPMHALTRPVSGTQTTVINACGSVSLTTTFVAFRVRKLDLSTFSVADNCRCRFGDCTHTCRTCLPLFPSFDYANVGSCMQAFCYVGYHMSCRAYVDVRIFQWQFAVDVATQHCGLKLSRFMIAQQKRFQHNCES